MTIFPADAGQPNASSNNWVAGQPATPNKVDSKLSADGKIKIYNDAGTVNVIVDVVGYYEPSSSGSSSGSTGSASVSGVDFEQGATPRSLTSSTPVVLASVTVNAPTAGVVVVSASVNLFLESFVSSRCGISTSTSFDGAQAGLTQASGTSGQFATYSADRGFSVAAGSATFNLICNKDNAGTAVSATVPNIIAVFSATQV